MFRVMFLRAMSLRAISLCVAACAVGGCGEPLVDSAYRGAPIFQFQGKVVAIEALPSDIEGEPITASIFWAIRKPDGGEALTEQASVSTRVDLLSRFEVTVFEPPRAEDLFEERPPRALGLVLLYTDHKDDGSYQDAEDRIVGATLNHVIAYTVDEDASGFSLENRSILCPAGLGDPADDSLPGTVLVPPVGTTSELLPPVDRCSVDSCRDDLHCDDRLGVCVPDRPLEITVFSGLKYELCLSAL